MSSRSKRTTTRKETVQVSASAPQSPSTSFTSPGRNRPPSPTMISRVQEKQELAGLNDRLASYIERVRFLENENSHLSKQVQISEETVRRETTNIKALYEKELQDARNLLDETSKQKAKLQLEVQKYRTDNHDLKEKLDRQNSELSLLQKRTLNSESQVNDLQARLNDANGQRKHWEDEYKKMKRDYDALLKQLEALKNQMEEETVKRVDLENKAQSLKEELDFKSQIHEQELNETVSRTRVEIEETDGRLQSEYDNKLSESLRDMREQNDTMIRMTREETEGVFARKLADLRDLAERKDNTSQKSQDEITSFRRRISELNSELTKLRSLTATHEARIKDLENELEQERDSHKLDVDRRDDDIRRLRDTLAEQLTEYRDLLDVKVALDIEINAYRKLLEGEESRLNLSQTSETSSPGRTPMRRTPSRATPVSVSRKRKRMAVETAETQGTSSGLSQIMESSQKGGYSSASSAKGSVEVYEVDTEGKYIKLYNSSESKDQPVGGWILSLTGGDEETTYKFHRSSQVKAGQYVTVWSSDQDVTHQPPHTLVMKGQKWFTADSMKASLTTNQGEDMASRELSRSQMRTSYTRSAAYTGRDVTDYGEEGRESEGRDSTDSERRRSWFWWSK